MRNQILVRCIKCQTDLVGERADEFPHRIKPLVCTTCGASFGWHDLPKECSKCHQGIYSNDERGVGVCSSCEVASWTPEKKAAMGKLIGLAFRKIKPSEAEIDATIDKAFEEL